MTRKADALVIEYPDVYKCIGETEIDKIYEMPESTVTYRKPRRLSEEQREAARERVKALKCKYYHSGASRVMSTYINGFY